MQEGESEIFFEYRSLFNARGGRELTKSGLCGINRQAGDTATEREREREREREKTKSRLTGISCKAGGERQEDSLGCME